MWVSNEILKNIASSCQAFGFTEHEILSRAQIKASELDISNGRQDGQKGIALWNSVSTITGHPHAGLVLGQSIRFDVLGWVAPLTVSSPTLMLAWKSFSDYSALMSDMLSYHLRTTSQQTIIIEYKPAPVWLEISPSTANMAIEHSMALTLALSRYLTGQNIRLKKAGLGYSVDKKYHKQFIEIFGSIVFDPEGVSYLEFEMATAELPIISGNRLVYNHMLEICEEKMLQSGNHNTEHQVIQILQSRQAYYQPKLHEVAARLNMSARTLQRKLQLESKTFQQIVESHQIELASALLQKPGIRVKEVAFMLGFNSVQTFSRAFKRKVGVSPIGIR